MFQKWICALSMIYLRPILFSFTHFNSNFQINNLEQNILYNVTVKTPLILCEIYANISTSILIVIWYLFFMYNSIIVVCEGQYRRTDMNVFIFQILNVNTSNPFSHECISPFLHVYALGFKYVFRDDICVCHTCICVYMCISSLNTYLACTHTCMCVYTYIRKK